MNQVLRYTVSGLLGFAITAALFVGMLSLLSGSKPTINDTESNIQFSFVKEFQPPKITPPHVREIPPEPKITQPPAAPSMPTTASEVPEIAIPTIGTQGKNNLVLNSINLPGVGNNTGTYQGGQGGTIRNGIAPMYPPKQQMQKTEGWVKVLLQVNEFGQVTAASVLEAKPARVFDAVTLKALKKWKFHPKLEGGQAVPFQVTQTIDFKIDQ